MTIGAAGFPTHSPEQYQVGNGIDANGDVMLILGFEVDGQWSGYRHSPFAAIEIVRTMSEWLDRAAAAHNASGDAG